MYFICRIWTSGICRGVSEVSEVSGAVSSQFTAVSLPVARNTQLPHILCGVCDERTFQMLH